MFLSFYGAAHEVTGSCFHLEVCGKNILIDCGMEQGYDEYESGEIPIPACNIDYVFLTHAHIDHSGRLPLLYAQGFRGNVYTTDATYDLCDIMLRDSAHIQMFEAEWKNRKNKRAGKDEVLPLYNMEDAVGILSCFSAFEYGETVNICDGIKIRFVDAGHLLGSSSIEIWVTDEGISKKFVFSGDIGNAAQPLIRDPQYINDADYVIMESTYGDRNHGQRPEYVTSLAQIIQETFDRGGNLVIPSFAVGRTQEILYFIEHGDFPVYVDSPLAIEATHIYNENYSHYFDDEALELIHQGINPISFSNLKIAVTSEDSKMINFNLEPKVIISASGMCEAGRIKHHLKHNLWREESTILFVGYQAQGTLGRSILEGADSVKIFGEKIEVKASIKSLPGISAHADCDGLIDWVNNFKPKPQQVFIVHGQDEVCDTFAKRLHDEFGLDSYAPYPGAKFDINNNVFISEGNKEHAKKQRNPEAVKPNSPFGRLIIASQRLANIIERNEGVANKELAKFADQVNSLCEKWER
ncbi:MAG: MBL fold metallo-hydrolase [Oscillospiraceae bacterium]